MAATYDGLAPINGNVFIDVLADRRWDNSQAITYFFDDAASISPWTESEKTAYRAALQTWADVANIFFEEVDTKEAANFVEQKYLRDGEIYADHEYPDAGGVAIGRFNIQAAGWSDLGLQPGGLGFQTLVHEIGHGLGLNHPHPDQGNDDSGFPGVVAESAYGDRSLNQTIYTVMSYLHGYHSLFGDPPSPAFGDAATPMPLDIAAIQHLYGNNTTNATRGENSYLLPDSNIPGTGWVGIYDISGLDQIKFEGSAPAFIDLRPLPLIPDPSLSVASYLSYATGVNGGFVISEETIVENAFGGSGNDEIYGNEFGNQLIGAGGRDELIGGRGNDTIRGGPGSDWIYGDEGADRIYAGGGFSTHPDAEIEHIGIGGGSVGFQLRTEIENALDLTGSFSRNPNVAIDRSTSILHTTVVGSGMPFDESGADRPFHWFKVEMPALATGFFLDMDNGGFRIDVYNSEGLWLDGSGSGSSYSPDEYLEISSGIPYSSETYLSSGFEPSQTNYISIYGAYDVPYTLHVSIETGEPAIEDDQGLGDFIVGGDGNDTIYGGAGADTIDGGVGDDAYYANTYLDKVIERSGEGYDTILASSNYIMPEHVEAFISLGNAALNALGSDSDNSISGNDSRNGIAGGAGNDTIMGYGGDDAIDGGVGVDSMVGGDGVDTYYVDNTGDQVVETELGFAKYDTVWTSLTSYILPANVEIYIAIGGAGNMSGVGNDDVTLMLGNEGNNTLSSLGGNDIILGRDGNDTINGGVDGGLADSFDIISGGGGADLLTGGGGHDYFNYEVITQGGDTITDFKTGAGQDDDILDFRPMFATFADTAGITTQAQAVASGHLTYTQSGGNTLVFADADGGGNDNVLMATMLNTNAASVQTYTLI